MALMPSFQIHVINSDFEARSDVKATDAADARTQALRSALAIGTDEMCRGERFFGAVIRIESDGDLQERFLVSMGQSPLK